MHNEDIKYHNIGNGWMPATVSAWKNFVNATAGGVGILIGPRVLVNIYLKEQTEFIQNQIDKIRDSVEDRQSRIAWQTINKVSRRKSTDKGKLKVTNQQERIKLWKQHFENLLGNPRKLLMNQSPELFVSN